MVEIVEVGVLGGEEGVEQYVEEAMFEEVDKEQELPRTLYSSSANG
jgi:hypothetical protein